MSKDIYTILRNDKLKYLLVNWNKEDLTVQNKCQLLKELVDVTADFLYNKNGKKYSEVENKYSIFVTSEKYFPIDKDNLTGRNIVVFQEDLQGNLDKYVLLKEFILKTYEAINEDIVIDANKPHILRDMKISDFANIQFNAITKNTEKKR